MALDVIDLISDENDQPHLGSSRIKFRSSRNDLLGDMVKISEPIDCKSMVFVELPAGFKSESRIPDRDQMTFVLSGILQISASEDEVRRIKSGDVFRLPKAQTSSHTLEVLGTEPVTMVVVQA